ncbi:hypothetical protein [Pseudomonas fitomaticsae]|uniref:DUF3829 domain-containing protein n=1 Tax=Pseudomonas fitomaticsae TaxID=2837969 RepID=A0ABY3PVU0_9PSED|nr:hypothetical protein [Pseudomonas fitomaticsae]UFP98011.1 hypothetical protein KJY40_18325 [Pseudomonas fitomaticsae]
MNTWKILWPALLIVTFSSGCSNIDPKDAVKLASSGQSVTSAANLSYQSSRDGLNKYLESEAISAAFLDRPDVGDETVTSIMEISRQLEARKDVFNQLGATYKTFGELASYDAAKEVEDKINGLSGALNEYAKATGSTAGPISTVTNLVVSKGGGLIASEAQKDQLKEASTLIRVRLVSLSQFLVRDVERLKRYKSEELKARARATGIFIGEGLGDPGQMATGYLTDAGFSSPSDGVGYWTTEVRKAYIASVLKYRSNKGPKPDLPPAYEAMRKYVAIRLKSQAEVQLSLLDEIRSSVDKLTGLHVDFEAGTPLSAASLTQSIMQLQELLKEYEAARLQDKA